MFNLSKRSLGRLEGVHPDLVKVVKRAIEITAIDFAVLEGLRTLETQKEYLKKGATTTLRSRHLTGHAVDLGAYIGGSIRWEWPLYDKLSEAVLTASKELDVAVEWGGNWKSFRDGPHFQLSWSAYPAD
mgnify:CR=1 FL=1